MTSATAYTKNIICEDPLVYTIDDVLTPEECDRFIELAKPTLTPSLVSTSNKGVTSNGRTSTNTWLLHDTDDVTKLIGERIAGIVEIPLANSENYQVVHYDISQEYRQHYDSWEHNGSEKTLRCMKFGGARLLTALVYLCDVEAGGGTRMTKLAAPLAPKGGGCWYLKTPTRVPTSGTSSRSTRVCRWGLAKSTFLTCGSKNVRVRCCIPNSTPSITKPLLLSIIFR